MPDPSSKTIAVVGLFDDPQQLVAAAKKVRDAGWRRWDCHTPYPVHGLDKAMGLRDSLIPFITIPAGIAGLILAKTMQWWMSEFDYPLMVGGKPLFSLPAFVPVTFELFVLLAAVMTFVGLLAACRLGRWRSPLHDAGLMVDVTSSRYLLYLDAADPNFSKDGARGLLGETNCPDIRTIEE